MKLLLAAGLVLALLLAPALARADPLEDKINALGGAPCQDSELTCVDFPVPYDHAQPASNRRLNVRFAVHYATDAAKGILFYAVGGPGAAGTALADSYLSSFDERLSKEMDVVFFDQRGVGPANGVDCPLAAIAFGSGAISLKAPDRAVDVAKGFARDCIAEMPHQDLLPYLSTDQAVQDVEAFRLAVGAPKIWFYGESYGTQFAQQYATRYPRALKGVILDGVVDLTLDAEHFYTNAVLTVEHLLTRMLDACDADGTCHKDMGAPAASVYDALAAKLEAGPLRVDFPLGAGGFTKRELTPMMLESDAAYALYGTDSRAGFLRALAAAAHDNLVPLLRLAYADLGADPETLGPVPDPTWYGGAYYAITCPDYDDAGQDQAARTKLILDQANALAPKAPRELRDFYAERLVCAFWPAKSVAARPAPFKGGDYPTLVLDSDTDPATPVSGAYGVFDHVENGYMVIMEGGPHVIWGRGLACPDKIVFGLMLDGRKPEKREQLCRQDFLDRYVRLTSAGGDALSFGRAVETELDQSPDLANWDGGDPIAIGCDHGGSLTATAAQSGTEYAFKDCALWAGVTVSGDGIAIDAGDGSSPDGLTLRLDIAGAHRGKLTYRHDKTTDAMSIAGSYDGADVTPSRPAP